MAELAQLDRMGYIVPGPVIYFETDFVEKGELILERARRASTLSLQSAYVRGAIAEISGILYENVVELTPVNKDPNPWLHRPGELRRSTNVLFDTMESGGDNSVQWSISVEQRAQNPYGTEYAPFVIEGHATRSGGWVEANPYPTAAMDKTAVEINEILDSHVARQIAEDTLHYIEYGSMSGS